MDMGNGKNNTLEEAIIRAPWYVKFALVVAFLAVLGFCIGTVETLGECALFGGPMP